MAFAEEHPEDAKRLVAERKPTDKSGTKVGDIADEMLRLIRQNAPLIVTQLDVTHATVTAAFDHHSPAATQEAAK